MPSVPGSPTARTSPEEPPRNVVAPPRTVALDAPGTALGRRLLAEFRRRGLEPVGVDEGPDALVVLAPGGGADIDGTGLGGVSLDGPRELLSSTAASSVVLLSSAMVHGAWPDNPVPLNEEAPVRPNPGCDFAAGRRDLEALGDELRRRRPGISVAALRPCVVVVPVDADPGVPRRGDRARWMERSAWHARAVRHTDTQRVAQYLHVDDLCTAVAVAVEERLDGPVEVAPDGWLDESQQLDLIASGRPPRLPAPVSRAVAAVRWRAGRTTTPPEVHPYTRHSWVVANDRLRSAGWAPRHGNDDALVLGHRPGWWSTLTPDRRQLLALGSMAGAVLVAAAGLTGAVRRVARRR
jgi:hypothetical protein